jgi:hypothetical protein
MMLCVRSWFVVIAAAAVAGCDLPPGSDVVSATPEPVTVCAAARTPVGQRIIVRGEFGGFAPDTQSRSVNMESDDLCNDRGAGIVFAELRSLDERLKLIPALPRGKRYPYTSGTIVTIEGRVESVREGRFTNLVNGTVR